MLISYSQWVDDIKRRHLKYKSQEEVEDFVLSWFTLKKSLQVVAVLNAGTAMAKTVAKGGQFMNHFNTHSLNFVPLAIIVASLPAIYVRRTQPESMNALAYKIERDIWHDTLDVQVGMYSFLFGFYGLIRSIASRAYSDIPGYYQLGTLLGIGMYYVVKRPILEKNLEEDLEYMARREQELSRGWYVDNPNVLKIE